MNKNVYFAFFVSLTLFFACQNKPSTPTAIPTFALGIDETLRPLMQEEIFIFQKQHPVVKVNAFYGSEFDLIKGFNNDSFSVFVMAREFNQTEMDFFAKQKIQPRYTPFGRDAVAFLVNQNNTDTLFTYPQLLEILSGKVTDWTARKKGSKNGAIQLVFDNANSSTANFVTQLIKAPSLPKNAFTAKSYQGVLDHVAKNRGAIGIVSSTYFSDLTTSQKADFNKNVNIVYVSAISPSEPIQYYQPDQANIIDSLYPVCRQLTYIDCSGDLAWGMNMASFLRYDTGQRIALKAGVMPLHVPSREVNVHIK